MYTNFATYSQVFLTTDLHAPGVLPLYYCIIMYIGVQFVQELNSAIISNNKSIAVHSIAMYANFRNLFHAISIYILADLNMLVISFLSLCAVGLSHHLEQQVYRQQ